MLSYRLIGRHPTSTSSGEPFKKEQRCQQLDPIESVVGPEEPDGSEVDKRVLTRFFAVCVIN
jgi:hypothetical protein